MKKLTLITLLTAFAFYGCDKRTVENSSNSIAVTKVQSLDVADIENLDLGSLSTSKVLKYERVEIEKTMSGNKNAFGANIITYATENPNKTELAILVPNSVEVFYTVEIQDLGNEKYFARYYSPDHILFLETQLESNVVTIQRIQQDELTLKKEDETEGFFSSFGYCLDASLHYIAASDYALGFLTVGMIAGYSGYILGGLVIGCSIYAL
ncbi:hypothetical protein FACS1894201_11180 [Bacteroidia bacterium]|nr:hypothetical protein FACS1894201_11180 [Bacteroidia bacterium]